MPSSLPRCKDDISHCRRRLAGERAASVTLMAAGKPGSPASRLLQNAVGSKTRGSLQYAVAKRGSCDQHLSSNRVLRIRAWRGLVRRRLATGRDADCVPDTEPTVGAGLLAKAPSQSHLRRQADQVRQQAGQNPILASPVAGNRTRRPGPLRRRATRRRRCRRMDRRIGRCVLRIRRTRCAADDSRPD